MSVKNVELSEPKASFRRLVNKHLAGRLGTSALIFFCFVFLYQDKKMKWVWAKPKTNIQYTNRRGLPRVRPFYNRVRPFFISAPLASTIKRLHDSTIQRDLCSAQTPTNLRTTSIYGGYKRYYHLPSRRMISPIDRSRGVVILMFSLLPSTRLMECPNASTTEASSVNSSLYGCR